MVLAAVALIGVFNLAFSNNRPASRSSSTTTNSGRGAISSQPQLVVSTAQWELPTPLSRTVAVAADGSLDLLGGLTGNGNSTTSSILQIDPVTGTSEQVGNLPVPVHDAAGSSIGSRYLVFGGGSSTLTTSVQQYSPDTAAGQSAAKVTGQLPQQRADLASATAPDGSIYLAGGYDGTNLLPQVLRTTDGTDFSTVANLPVPVRYPALAIDSGRLWVIGGESGGVDTDDIQTIDLKTHTATIAGHLPEPIAHAGAAVVGGKLLVIGGRSGADALDTVLAIDTNNQTVTQAATLPLPTSDMGIAQLGDTTYILGGEGQLGMPQQSVMIARMVSASPPAKTSKRASGQAAAPIVPFVGKLLIADRGNDRLLLVNTSKQILWSFPSPAAPAPPQGFYFPDDAFFAKNGTAIITNQEDQDTILEIAFPSGKVLASYGHPNVPGSTPGYLNQPDDAYLLKDGRVVVADAKNCRILFLNPDFTYSSAIGNTGRCQHDIPNDVAYPNGDTPLADGNFLISEIDGSYVDEVTATGQVVWSLKLPIAYPSDPQQLGPDLYLIADYSRPGGLYEFTREGKIVWKYQVSSGEGMLDHPSLTERLPNGLLCVNDDYRHRVVIINPADNQIVWQYGLTDTAGTGPDQLKTPDGFDLLAPDNSTPTHPTTG